MKLTASKSIWVKNKIMKYCKEMNCENPNFLFLKKSEWQEWAEYKKETLSRNRYRNANNCLGICNHKNRIIAIFVKSHKSLKDVDDTIRHELVHLVRRYVHHSKQFTKCMTQIKQGKLKALKKNIK